jgi:hypothetical protein
LLHEKSRLGHVAKSLFSVQPEETPRETERDRTAQTTGVKADAEVWREAIGLAEEEPRMTFVSSKSKAVLVYLRKTTPEFNISKALAVIVEEAIKGRYPELWKNVE